MHSKKVVEQEYSKLLFFFQDWDKIKNNDNVNHIALLAGLPSIIVLLIDCYENSPQLISESKIKELVKHSINILKSENELLASYCSGLAGFGFYLLKLKESNLFLEKDEDNFSGEIEGILVEIDEILEEQIKIYLLEDNYDILHGLVGLGLYFLERDNLTLTNVIVEELDKIKIVKNNQISWTKYDKYKNYSTVYDMGNAHGNASILYFLSKITARNKPDIKVNELIKGLIIFYLENAQKIEGNINSYYPSHIKADKFNLGTHEPENSRLAWCYGDLGVLHTLLVSSLLINENEIYNNVVEKLENVVKRRSLVDYVDFDAGFCHGTSGIAIIFNNIYTLTGKSIFLEASEFWVNQTLKRKDNETNSIAVLGYNFPINNDTEQQLTLLEGLSGVLFCYSKYLYKEMPLTEETLFMKY